MRGLGIAFCVMGLVGSLLSVLLGFLWKRWRSRSVFRRTLVRGGLPETDAEELTTEYHAIRLGELLHLAIDRRRLR